MGDVQGESAAAGRLLALDPRGPWVQAVQRAHLATALPGGSPTAAQTRRRRSETLGGCSY